MRGVAYFLLNINLQYCRFAIIDCPSCLTAVAFRQYAQSAQITQARPILSHHVMLSEHHRLFDASTAAGS